MAELLARGIDHAGAPVAPFIDDEGGWPLRCCLTSSTVGENIAIIGFSPFPWTSAYRETGPLVVHAQECAGADGSFPIDFEQRDQVVRAFGRDSSRTRTQVYDLNALVRAGEGLQDTIERVLSHDRVEFIQVNNVLAQCHSFTAARSPRLFG